MSVVKKRNFSKATLNKPVSTAWVYYTTGDGRIHKISINTLLRRLNKVSFSKRWYQTIREAQIGLGKWQFNTG